MKRLVKCFIKGYQKVCRPIAPHTCRFYPSCSEYSLAAVEKYGTVKGLLKSILRIMRCSPLSKGGYDPIK